MTPAPAIASLLKPISARRSAPALQPALCCYWSKATPVSDRVPGWAGDPSSRADALALRFAGGLHALALQGRPIALQSLCANPNRYTDIEMLAVLPDAIDAPPDTLLKWLDSAPQTNEVRRYAAPIAAGHWLAPAP